MSFMHITCPWCGVEYTFGVVGKQQIGSGHRCEVQAECDTTGCSRLGSFYVAPRWPDDDREFSCSAHVGQRAIVMCRSGDGG
jgi:hypothetical protein